MTFKTDRELQMFNEQQKLNLLYRKGEHVRSQLKKLHAELAVIEKETAERTSKLGSLRLEQATAQYT